jgi:tetratricopeptide (TPR) repeat protein
MGQAGDYEALIRELLVGVAGGWSYGNVTVWLWGVDEEDLTLYLRKFAEGLLLERDRDLIEQLKLLGKMTPGKLASEALTIVARLDRSYEQNSELLNHEAWFSRGIDLREQGLYQEAIASYDWAIKIKPDKHEYWYERGIVLGNLGRNEEAISSYDRAIEIKSDKHEYWYNRGVVLGNLGRYEEAITSYDSAIRINNNFLDSWKNKGGALFTLERYEDALDIVDQEIKIKPDNYEAWCNKGHTLHHVRRYEEAIASYDQAIKINGDKNHAWSIRGNIFHDLGRYEEAIISYSRATELDPNDFNAWLRQGVILCDILGKPKQAIESFNRAIEIDNEHHSDNEYHSWYNRSVAIGLSEGYQAKIDAIREAFKNINLNTYPEGWGFLQNRIGRTHYKEGNNQSLNDSKDYYIQALSSYKEALKTLTREEFPELRLETLIYTAKVYLAQKQPPAALDCKIEAADILRDLLNAEPTFAGKKRLQLKYTSLRQLDVDLFVASGDNIRALQAAELDKNNHLTWLLTALDETIISPKYDQMQQLLITTSGDRLTGIVYWHLSPDNLTTFILHPHKPQPEVLTSPSQNLWTWLKKYDLEKIETANWQELGNILQISQINPHLDGIEHLILIPHRDLHRLPLHSYWQNLTTTYLPSIQIGLNLQAKPQPDRSAGFLLIESPDYRQPIQLKGDVKSLSILSNAEIEAAIIAHLFQPKTIIPMGEVSKDNLCAAFNTPHAYGHFNGHAYHDPRRPQDSSLFLDGDTLTCPDFAQIDLTPYYLISLSACETGITSHQTIDTEYVGLVSAFLSRGTNYVISTLWSVQDLPSSLLMMAFYMYIKKGVPAPLALQKAAHWLKNLTHAKEAEFHQNICQRLPQNSPAIETVSSNRKNAEAAAEKNPDAKPYSSPDCWAAFTISGWG